MLQNNEAFKYRWIILFCAAVVQFFSWGILFSVGVYYVRWIDYFGAKKAQLAIVGGIPAGTACVLAPLFGLIIHHHGVRKAGIAGGLILAFSQIASSFAPNIIFLGLSYGFLTGLGSGLCNFSASVILNQYFIKQRSLAEGIMSMGVGTGTFVLTLFNQFLINTYDWRGSLLILGAASLHLVVLFQLMIPPKDLKNFAKLRCWKSANIEVKKEGKNGFPRLNHENKATNGHCRTYEFCPNGKKCLENDLKKRNVNCKMEERATVDHISEYEISSVLSIEFVSTEVKDKYTTCQGRLKLWLIQCLGLYRNPIFVLLIVVNTICRLCVSIPYVHLAERSRLEGIDVDTTAWICSTMGLAGIFGRLLLSSIPSLFKVNVFYVYGFSNAFLGVISIITPFFPSKEGLFVYAALFGFFCIGPPLAKASAADLLGTKIFPLIYSWILFYESLGNYFGPPLAGWLYDITLSYDCSFYFMGAGLIFVGLLVSLRNATIRWESRLRLKNEIVANGV